MILPNTASPVIQRDAAATIYSTHPSKVETYLLPHLALPDKEGAIWQFNARNFKGSNPILLTSISEIRNSKLNRNGDMGADPADSFEAPLQPQQLQSCPAQIDGTLYILLENQELRTLTTAEGETLFKKDRSCPLRNSLTHPH